MSDDAVIRAALAGLGSAQSSDVEMALLQLESVATSTRGLKTLCGKDVRKRITAFAAAVATRSSSFATAAVLRLLRSMCDTSRAASRAVYLEVGLRSMIAVLRRSSTPIETLVTACELLLCMSRHTRKFALSMRLDGGIDALCALVGMNPEHALLSVVCELLQKICDGNDNNIRLAHKRGAVRAAMQCLRARVNSASVCAPLMSLLAILCEGVRYRAALEGGDDDAFPLIISVLRRHVDDSDIAIAGLTLINSLASDADTAARMCSAGAFSTGWAAVVRHVGTPGVLRQAMATMWRLVAGLTPRPAGSAEGAQPAVAATVATASSMVVQAYAAAASGSSMATVAPPMAGPSASMSAASYAPVPPGVVLTILRAAAGMQASSGPGTPPPTTLTQWALPHRYLFACPVGLADVGTLPRWAGYYLPRPGWYPAMPTTLQAFHIAYAVARAKGGGKAAVQSKAGAQPSKPPAHAAGAVRRPSVPSTATVSGGVVPQEGADDDTATDLISSISFFGSTPVIAAAHSSNSNGTDEDTAVHAGVDADIAEMAHRAILAPASSSAMDLQTQLRLQINALLDADGLLRTFRPTNRMRSVSAPDADADAAEAGGADAYMYSGGGGVTPAALLGARNVSTAGRSRPMSWSVSRSGEGGAWGDDDPSAGGNTPASPYRSYRGPPGGVSISTSSMTLGVSAGAPPVLSSPMMAGTASLLQLAETRVEAGTVTLAAGAMGIGISRAAKRRGGPPITLAVDDSGVAADAITADSPMRPVLVRPARSASTAMLPANDAFSMVNSNPAAPGAARASSSSLPALGAASSTVRRYGSKPDVLRSMVGAASAGEDGETIGEGRPPLPRIRSSDPSAFDAATSASPAMGARRDGGPLGEDAPGDSGAESASPSKRGSAAPPLRRASTFSGSPSLNMRKVSEDMVHIPALPGGLMNTAWPASSVVASGLDVGYGGVSTSISPAATRSAPSSPLMRSRASAADVVRDLRELDAASDAHERAPDLSGASRRKAGMPTATVSAPQSRPPSALASSAPRMPPVASFPPPRADRALSNVTPRERDGDEGVPTQSSGTRASPTSSIDGGAASPRREAAESSSARPRLGTLSAASKASTGSASVRRGAHGPATDSDADPAGGASALPASSPTASDAAAHSTKRRPSLGSSGPSGKSKTTAFTVSFDSGAVPRSISSAAVLNPTVAAGGHAGASWATLANDSARNAEKPALRKAAFEGARCWLQAPHWFPELQSAAYVLWDLAPLRSLLWKNIDQSLVTCRGSAARAGTEAGEYGPPPVLRGDRFDESASHRDREAATSLMLQEVMDALLTPAMGGVRGIPVDVNALGGTAAGNRSSGFPFPARSVQAVHPADIMRHLPAASHVRDSSIAFVRVLLSRPSAVFDESRLCERRLPSTALDGSSTLPAAAKTLLQETCTDIDVPLSSGRCRALRVYLQPSGAVSVRKFVVPPSALPTAFHCSPPLGRLHREASSRRAAGMVHAAGSHSLMLLPSAVTLNAGYVLLRAPPADLPCLFDEPTELPEPMLITNSEIRSGITGRTMLQTIARVGVAAAQLMRHRFLGAGNASNSAPAPADSAADAGSAASAAPTAPSQEEEAPPALVALLMAAQSRNVYHRYADLGDSAPSSMHAVSWRTVNIPLSPPVAESSALPVAVQAALSHDVTLCSYPYAYAELTGPVLGIPKSDLGVAVCLAPQASGEVSLPADPAVVLDTLHVADALRTSMPPLGEDDDGGEDGGDDDSQGSDDDDMITPAPQAHADGDSGAGGGETADDGGDALGGEEEEEDAEGGDAGATSSAAGEAGAGASERDTEASITRGASSARAKDASMQASIMSAAKTHIAKMRERRPPVSMTKRDVMRVLAEAADDVQSMLVASGPSAVASLRTLRNQLAAAIADTARMPAAPSAAALPTDASVLNDADPALAPRVDVLSKIPALEFESRFECGNLCAATRVGPLEYELTLDADVNTAGHTQWFYFRARRMVAEDGSLTAIAPGGRLELRQVVNIDKAAPKPADDTPFRFMDTSRDMPALTYRFHVVNLEKGGSSFNDGMRPLIYYQLAPGFDGNSPGAGTSMFVPPACSPQATYAPTLTGEGWRRAAFDIVYYRNQYTRMKAKHAPPVSYDDVEDAAGAFNPSRPTILADVPRPSPQYSETWSVTFPPGVHTVFFAYCYPYSYTDLRRDMVRWERRAARFTFAGEVLNLGDGLSSSPRTGEGHMSSSSPAGGADAPAEVPAGDDVLVAIREWDRTAAVGPVDGLGNDIMSGGKLKYAAAGGTWMRAGVPFSARTGFGPASTHVPMGTLYSSPILHRTHLCHSIAGNPVPLMTITDFTSGPAAIACRPYIILSGRVHPGETNGSWMMRGVIDFLTSSAPVAVELRRRVIFKIVPMLNPDGVINGHHRTNLAGLDLNRHWTVPDLARAPTIWHLRHLIMTLQARAASNAMLAEGLVDAPLGMEDLGYHDAAAYIQLLLNAIAQEEGGETLPPAPGAPPAAATVRVLPPVPQPVLLFCDFHGHSRRQNVFTFGCHELTHDGAPFNPGEIPGEPYPINPGSRLFPKLLAARVDTFTYKGCGWKVQREKLHCARVAMWRDACLSCAYTIEASFGGSDTGSRSGVHFTTRQYEEVGHAFCLALLDWLEAPTGGPRPMEAFARLRRAAAAMQQNMATGLASTGAASTASISRSSADTGGGEDASGRVKRPKTAASGALPKGGAAAAAPAALPRAPGRPSRRSLRKAEEEE